MVLACRLQVLADSQEIDVRRAQVVHDLEDLVPLLAEPDHDAGLGEHRRIELFDPLQQADRGEVARARSHGEVFRRHGLEVVVEDVGLCRRPPSRRAPSLRRKSGVSTSIVVAGHCARMARMTRGKVRRPAVVEVVAVDRGDDHMREPELGRRLGDMLGLGRIERAGQAGLHVAEGAGARAGVAHDHEGRVLLLPALADIGAARPPRRPCAARSRARSPRVSP